MSNLSPPAAKPKATRKTAGHRTEQSASVKSNGNAVKLSRAVTASVRGQSVLALASAEVEGLLSGDKVYAAINDMKFTALACNACGGAQHSVTASGAQPFCVLCGSEDIAPTGKPVPSASKLQSDNEAVAVKCGACGTHNVFQSAAVTAANGKVHCVTCGTPVAVSADDIGDPDLETNSLDGVDDGVEDLMVTEGASEDDDFDLDDGADDEFEASSDLAGGDSEEFPLMLENGDASDGDVDVDVLEGDSFTEGEEFDGSVSADDAYVDVPPLEVGEPLIDTIGLDDANVNVDFVESATRVIVMSGCYAIATATPTTAGKNGELIFSSDFQGAMVETARSLGLRKSLAQFGFKLIKAPVADTASLARKVVEAKMAETSKTAKQNKVFNDCMALAAVGLARGLWKGANNPLRAGFEQALEQAGVRSPKRVTAQVFSEDGIKYTTVLIEVANKLSKMSEVARKEYADMLDMVADDQEQIPTEVADSDGDFGEDGGNSVYGSEDEEDLIDLADDVTNVTSRFYQAASLARNKPQGRPDTQVTAHAILAGTAPLKFNF